MLEKSVMYFIYKGAALAASLMFMLKAGVKIEFVIILALAFSCIFLAEYILDKLTISWKGKVISFLNVILLFILVLLGVHTMYPLMIVILVVITEHYCKGDYFYTLSIGFNILLGILLVPNAEVLFLGMLLLCLLYYNRFIRNRVEASKLQVLEQKEELAFLNQKLQDNQRLTKTLQYTAALEERNRLAARLHDKVGHGISGSIILLEASRLMLDKDMVKAKEGIDKAVANLRDGVDDIRAALREERPVRSELGLNEIQTVLEKFQVNHNINTRIEQFGNLDYIGLDIWQCIYDNLEEVLTNILKHSNATHFKLTIKILPKIIRVEYGDNGKTEGKFFKGLGLEAIEERTIKCGGRCFLEKSSQEFLVTNIFTY